MSEQVLEEQEVEEEKEEFIEVEGTPVSKVYNEVKTKKEYLNSEFRKRIIQLRSENPPKSWGEVTDIVNKEFNLKITRPTVQNIYNQEIARTITVEKKAGKKFTAYETELESLYGRTVKLLSKLLDNIDKVEKEFESSDMTDIQKYLNFLKLAPTIKQTTDSIFSAIRVQQEQQDKIRVEQKNYFLSDLEIRDRVQQYLSKLISQGKIKVIRDDPMLPKIEQYKSKFD